MKPAPFEYRRATSIPQALAWLAEDPEARLIAGGQTLMPMLAMRLVRPTKIIDIARIPGLDGLEIGAESITLGATLRQVSVERSADVARLLPLLGKAIIHVGHPPTRRRGTIGGSIANADPAAEIALVAVTLGAEVLLAGAGSMPARDFFLAPMTTALPAGAMVRGLRFACVDRTRRGTGFAEVAMRHGDYALAAAACELALDKAGRCVELRLGIGGATPVPMLLPLDPLRGSELSEPQVREAVAAALAPLEMLHDPNSGADYRRRAALVLATQAVSEAKAEATRCG
jgi:CO/xanthine dehydrogenase FAD-binding subunit